MAPRSIPLFCQFFVVALFTLLQCSGGSAWVYTMGTLIDDVDSLPVFASSTHVLPGDLWDHSYGIDIPALSLGTCQTDRVTPYSCITSLSAFARPLQFSFDDQLKVTLHHQPTTTTLVKEVVRSLRVVWGLTLGVSVLGIQEVLVL